MKTIIQLCILSLGSDCSFAKNWWTIITKPLLYYCTICLAGLANAQQPIQFEHLELSSRARVILQDHQGFMWFGTDRGLTRYDGYELKEYLANPFDPNPDAYKGGGLGVLIEDQKGHLWMGSYGASGVYRFDLATEEFRHYLPDPQDSSSLTNGDVLSIYEDSNGQLWVSTRGGGLHLFDSINNSFTHYFHHTDSNDYHVNSVWNIFEYKADEFWLSTNAGVVKFNYKTRNYIPWSFKNGQYWLFYRDYNNQIWASGQKLARYDEQADEFIPFQFSNLDRSPKIGPITGNGLGKLYLSTYDPEAINQDGAENAIAILDIRSAKITQHIPILDDPYSLKNGSIGQLLVDQSGNLWIKHEAMSGSARIVEVYNPNKLIRHYVNYLPEQKRSTDLTVLAIHIDSVSNIWIGTLNHGLIKYNRATGISEQYLYDPDKPGAFGWKWGIYSIYADKYGILWVGSWSSGLYKLNPKTGEWKNYKKVFEEQGLAWDRIGRIYEDSKGYLWIGCLGSSLNRVKLDDGEGFNREIVSYDRYAWDINDASGISDFRIFTIHEDQHSNIWIGTGGGLDRFVPKKNNFTHYLPEELITSLYTDDSGTFWVGTRSGLFKGENLSSDPPDTDFKFERVEFPREFLGIRMDIGGQDGQGNYWIGWDNKMIRYNRESGDIKIFDKTDGVNLGALQCASQLGNGEVAVGGNNGFITFNPDSTKNTFIPPIIVTDFLISGRSITLRDSLNSKPILTKVVNHSKAITLPYGQNFTFQFTSLNYNSPHRNQYRYKMEGFDKEWSPPSTTRTATYTNLWEGSYTFKVKGSNNDGVWNEEGTSIQLTILPPIWRTWWAYAIYALAFMGILFGFVRFMLIRERLKGDLKVEHMELEKVKEMDQMKTQFFANISHEFRTPLTLILGPLRQMRQGIFKGDQDTVFGVMIRNSKRLLHLINQLLDFSKLEAGAVTLQASVGDLVEFMRTMFSAFESTGQSRKMRYLFQSDVSSLPSYFDRDKLEKVIINLISNAFKFTNDEGSIEVKMSKKVEDPAVDKGEGIVEIRIEDSGKGIPAGKLPHVFDRFYQVDPSSTRAQEGTGIGLALAKELVELHHGNISVVSSKGKGSTFIIHLPLGRHHLQDDQVVVRKGYQPIDTDAIEALPEHIITTSEKSHQAIDNSLPLLLIIDDNEDMRLYLKEVLGEYYRLFEAPDGRKGWDIALEQVPDLIISDVMMPEMDGHQLCQELKTDERTSHIPVVLLTARAGEEAKIEGLETGADDYITKPFSPVELKVRVQNLIEQRQKLREQFSRNLSLQPKDIAITSADERFLQRALDILEIHRSDADFNADAFIKEIGMSRSQLHRKLKALIDQSTGEFIRSYRLNYAKQLIEKDFGNMAQVAYECGFNNPSYFAECFKKQFGIKPSQYKASSEIEVSK